MVKDSGFVLRSAVSKLPTRIGWVDLLPENIEQFPVAGDGRIVGYLHGLIMARSAAADLLIAGIVCIPACVSCCYLFHSLQRLERLLHAPEATAGEGCFL